MKNFLAVCCVLGAAGCGIPPVDTTYISAVPASAQSFAVAQRAVRACSTVSSPDRVLSNFRKAGFQVSDTRSRTFGGASTELGSIIAPDPTVTVFYEVAQYDKRQIAECNVGLAGMTPEQSKQLADIWVKAHGAKSNAEHGDGLSDHVSGAWRRLYTGPKNAPPEAAYIHRLFITSFKTWPHGPYAVRSHIPSAAKEVFPKKPGAAVRLRQTSECQNGLFLNAGENGLLPCSALGDRVK